MLSRLDFSLLKVSSQVSRTSLECTSSATEIETRESKTSWLYGIVKRMSLTLRGCRLLTVEWKTCSFPYLHRESESLSLEELDNAGLILH